MDSSSSSSSRVPMRHQVFLSFRGEDTRWNFTSHLLEALKKTGMNVFFDEEKLEKGEQLSQELSLAIEASNISLIVLSADYASSKSCLAEVSDIMHRKLTQGRIVLPIFYHIDPSDVRNIGGSFKTSFDYHESNRPGDEVKQWKANFVEVGKLKGWHIQGGKLDRPETVYIQEIVEYVTKKLNSMCKSVSEELVGIEDQKNTIMRLIHQEGIRVIGVWGMGGVGKTTLADVVYNEISSKFQTGWFLQNVREKIEKQGMESLRNELLSKLLNQEIRIDTPSIGSTFIQQRLNNKRVLVVLDDVNNSSQIDCLGVKHFGHGSKIIVTSRDIQVLRNGGADRIHEVKMLNKKDSLQLFSKFAFKLLNPPVDFRDLSYKFVDYAQGSPLALKVLGSKLHTKSRKEWESEVDTLNEYVQPQISQILKRSFDELPEPEKNIFLDIAIFFKGEPKENVEKILSSCYKGAVCGISNLVDKCLLDITPFPFSFRDMIEIRSRFLNKNAEEKSCFYYDGALDDGLSNLLDKAPQCISMHDMLQDMGKEIVQQESKRPSMRSRLWNHKDVYQVLKYNKGTESTEGIKLDMFQIDKQIRLCPTVFENMLNLRYINFYFSPFTGKYRDQTLHASQVDSVSLPDELRLLCWEHYPFKSLSSFNPQNLVVLKLSHGDMEQLWNNDDHLDLVNLRKVVLSDCKKLRKIPNLLSATNLEILCFNGCKSLVEFPCFSHLTSLKKLQLHGCRNLKKFPELQNDLSLLNLTKTGIEEVPDSVQHLVGLEMLCLSNSSVKNVSKNISKMESLRFLDLSHCLIAEFPELPRILVNECAFTLAALQSVRPLPEVGKALKASSSQELPSNITNSGSRGLLVVDMPLSNLRFKSLGYLKMNHCMRLRFLSDLPPYLRYLNAHGCTSLGEVWFTSQDLYEFHSLDGEDEFCMIFSNCFELDQDSIDNIEENAMLKVRFLAKKHACGPKKLICCIPGNEISAYRFEYQSVDSSLLLKIAPNVYIGRRFLVFAICLVADLTHCHISGDLEFICEYQLTVAGGGYEKFRTEWCYKLDYMSEPEYMDDHKFILFSGDMVKKDKDYEEVSFQLYIRNRYYSGEDDDIKVKKSGVHVSYVDEEGNVLQQRKRRIRKFKKISIERPRY